MHEYTMLAEGWERKQRTAWEVARWQVYYDICLNPNLKPASKPRKVTDVARFPWEPEDAEQPETKPADVRVTPEMNDILNTIINGQDR